MGSGPISTRASRGEDEECGEPDPRSPYSERITQALTAHLTMALRVKVANSPHVAMAMFVQHALPSVLGPTPMDSLMPLTLTVEHRSVCDRSPDLALANTTQSMKALAQAWRSRLPTSGQLDWLMALPFEDLSSLFALCIAQSIDAVEARSIPHEGTRELMRAVSLDMAEHWRATGENFLGGIKKDQVLAAVAEGAAPDVADTLKKCKKGELIDKATAALANTRWVPAAFRF